MVAADMDSGSDPSFSLALKRFLCAAVKQAKRKTLCFLMPPHHPPLKKVSLGCQEVVLFFALSKSWE